MNIGVWKNQLICIRERTDEITFGLDSVRCSARTDWQKSSVFLKTTWTFCLQRSVFLGYPGNYFPSEIKKKYYPFLWHRAIHRWNQNIEICNIKHGNRLWGLWSWDICVFLACLESAVTSSFLVTEPCWTCTEGKRVVCAFWFVF